MQRRNLNNCNDLHEMTADLSHGELYTLILQSGFNPVKLLITMLLQLSVMITHPLENDFSIITVVLLFKLKYMLDGDGTQTKRVH